MLFKLLNGSIYTVLWLALVIGGAKGVTGLPLVATAFAILGQLAYIYKFESRRFKQDLFILLIGACIGFFMEMGFIHFAFLHYATENSLSAAFPPAWLLSIYFLLILTLNESMVFLNRSRILAFSLGLVGSMMSYYAGKKIGAVNFPSPLFLLCIGISWGIYLAALIHINLKLKNAIVHHSL
jgi:hypothetical protein